MKKTNQQGFTVLELMIATLVFSVILLVATFGLLQVGRMFYKGLTMSRTQEAARSVMEEISQNIQFSGENITKITGPNVNLLCIGDKRYSYIKGRMLSQTPTGDQKKNLLVTDITPECTAAQPIDQASYTLTSSSKELLQPRMRLSELSVDTLPNGLYSVTVRIAYGENDLLENYDQPTAQCKSIRLGSQFCAVAELKTTVLKRVNSNIVE